MDVPKVRNSLQNNINGVTLQNNVLFRQKLLVDVLRLQKFVDNNLGE